MQGILRFLLGELNGRELPEVTGLIEKLPVMGLKGWVRLGVVFESLKDGFERLGAGEVGRRLGGLLIRPAVVGDVGFGDVEELKPC